MSNRATQKALEYQAALKRITLAKQNRKQRKFTRVDDDDVQEFAKGMGTNTYRLPQQWTNADAESSALPPGVKLVQPKFRVKQKTTTSIFSMQEIYHSSDEESVTGSRKKEKSKHSSPQKGSQKHNKFGSVISVAEAQARKKEADQRKLMGKSSKLTTLDILESLLDLKRIESLRLQFDKEEEGLDKARFVQIMAAHCPELEGPLLIPTLVELFSQIDANGDGDLSWDEFTNFIVESGMVLQDRYRKDAITPYYPSPIIDDSQHHAQVDKVFYVRALDQLIISERSYPVVLMYNPQELTPTRQLRGHKGQVLSAEAIPEHGVLATSGADMSIMFWDMNTWTKRKSMHERYAQMKLLWSREYDTLYSAGADSIIRGYDVRNTKEKFRLEGHNDIVMDLLAIPGLDFLASASLDQRIILWDMPTRQFKKELKGHTKGILSLTYSQDYRFLVSGGSEHDAIIWNPFVETVIFRLRGHNSSLIGVEAIEGTPQIVTADSEGFFKVWDIRNFRCVQTFQSEDAIGKEIASFCAVPAYKRVVCSARKLIAFDFVDNMDPRLTDQTPVLCTLYNPASSTFVTAGSKSVKLWDAATGKLKCTYRDLSQHEITSFCLDDRLYKFVVGDHAGNIRVFNYSNGAFMKSLEPHQREVSNLIYSGASKTVISGSWDTRICIHDENSVGVGGLLRAMKAHNKDITCMSYSAQLHLVVSGSNDTLLKVWDYRGGKLDGMFDSHEADITAVTFLGKHPCLFSADSSGVCCIWTSHPSPYKYRLLLKFENKFTSPTSGEEVASCISAAAYCEDQMIMYTGDEHGEIKAWDMKAILKALHMYKDPNTAGAKVAPDDPESRVSLPGAITAVMAVKKFKKMYRKRSSIKLTVPYVTAHQMPMIGRWQAHTDGIRHLHVTEDPRSVISSGYDCMVHIWSAPDGAKIGSLHQGISPEEWYFPVNIVARDRMKKQEVDTVMNELEEIDPLSELETESTVSDHPLTAEQNLSQLSMFLPKDIDWKSVLSDDMLHQNTQKKPPSRRPLHLPNRSSSTQPSLRNSFGIDISPQHESSKSTTKVGSSRFTKEQRRAAQKFSDSLADTLSFKDDDSLAEWYRSLGGKRLNPKAAEGNPVAHHSRPSTAHSRMTDKENLS